MTSSRPTFGPLAVLAVALAFVFGTAASARAQYNPGGGAGGFFSGHSDNPVGPTVSPYLNLLNLGNQAQGLPTYQALVKPLEDQRNESLQNQADIQRLQRDTNPQRASHGGPIRGTGSYSGGSQNFIRTRFQNYSHYYSFKGH